ncbi:MAG: PEP-CTERM sorting domain-containing protein, partial [Rubripirellula sp.]|nr:PEP-CTERM sorting domain-containing protein [Rubripirellula sp.]
MIAKVLPKIQLIFFLSLPNATAGILVYDESTDGDIASPPIGDPLNPIFNLGVGVNTVTGAMTHDTRNQSDPIQFPHDFDSFAFSVPNDGLLTVLSINATEDQGDPGYFRWGLYPGNVGARLTSPLLISAITVNASKAWEYRLDLNPGVYNLTLNRFGGSAFPRQENTIGYKARFSVQQVPEPSSLAIFGIGALGMIGT